MSKNRSLAVCLECINLRPPLASCVVSSHFLKAIDATVCAPRAHLNGAMVALVLGHRPILIAILIVGVFLMAHAKDLMVMLFNDVG